MLETFAEEIVCLGVTTKGERIPLTLPQLIKNKGCLMSRLNGIQLFKYVMV